MAWFSGLANRHGLFEYKHLLIYINYYVILGEEVAYSINCSFAKQALRSHKGKAQ